MTAALGWLGSALVVLSLTQRDVRRLRQLNLAAAIALGIFNIVVGIASMIALNVVLAAINGYHLRPRCRSRRRQTQRLVRDLADRPRFASLP